MSADADATLASEAADTATSNDQSQAATSPRSRPSRSSRSRSRLRRVAAEADGVADLDVAADVDLPVLELDTTAEATPQLESASDTVAAPLPEVAATPDTAEPGASRRRRPGGRRNSRSGQPETNSAATGSEPELAAATPATESETLEIATLIPGLDIDPQVLPGSDSTPDGDTGETTDANSERSGASSRRSRRGGRRRRGGRDQAAEAAPAADSDADLSAVSAEGDAPDEGVLELSDEDDSSTLAAVESLDGESNGDTNTAAPPADDAAARRSRRSQRGGRRKGRADSDQQEGGGAAGDVAQSAPADEFNLLPTVQARTRWTAPPLVPALGSPLPSLDLGMQASLDVQARGFVLNGQRVPANLFFVNSDPALLEGSDAGPLIPEVVSGEIRRAAQAGIHLHTCVTYLPLLNAYGERSFAAVDATVQMVIDADPEAKLVLRVQCVPTNFWARTHEQEMASYADGSVGDVTIASAAFWADCVDALQALLAHLAEENSPARGRVFALHLDKGEWFYEPGAGYDYSEANLQAFRNWLHQKYQTLYALRAAWFDGKVTFDTAAIPPATPQAQSERRGDTVLLSQKRDRRVVDYVTYASSVVGNVVCGLAAAVKAITGGKLLVFVPYGYLFEFAARNDSGHQALTEVLACDSIDVLTGPNSYLTRAAGGVGGFAAPVDSLPLHGKLWIVEDDTKTYLAASDTPDSYNPKISSQQETVMVLRRNFYAALAHGCGLSWMDLWGQGWLDSDSVWDEISRMIAASEAIRQTDDNELVAYAERAPEVAVLVDDASYAWVRGDAAGRQLQSGLIVKARDLLQRSGASIGHYLQSDAGRLPDSAKVVFFLNALSVTTLERQAIREKLQTAGKTLVWVYAPGLFDENGPAPSELTEIVGMPLKAQPWNSQVGTLFTDERHMITERLRGGKRMGTEEALNPSYAAIDPQATVLGVYAQSGETSIAAKTAPADGAWRSVFVGEPQFTGELVRGILRYAGVHLYDTQDDIVFVREDPGVGGGLLVVHSPYTGQRVIQLPRPAACYNATEGRLVAQHSTSVRLFLRGRSTQTFFWGDLEAVARQAGLSVDDLIATQAPQQQRGNAEGQGDNDSSDGEPRAAVPSTYERPAGEAVEYPHDREYIVSSERMTTVEYTSVTSTSAIYDPSAAPSSVDADLEIEPALEQVLRAVVEEVYSGAYSQPSDDENITPKTGAAAAPDAMRDARREASRITEALLADISGEHEATSSTSLYNDDADDLDLPEGEQGTSVVAGEQDGGAQTDDASSGQRSSSRRRRWRRKRQQGGASGESAAGTDAGTGAPPPAPKFSVEQIIGDLLRRRKPPEPSE